MDSCEQFETPAELDEYSVAQEILLWFTPCRKIEVSTHITVTCYGGACVRGQSGVDNSHED